MHEEIELPGVAALADRPVDGRRVAIVMGVVGLLLSVVCALLIERLLATADEEPEGGRLLRAHAAAALPTPTTSRRVAIVLVDGLRTDEASRLGSWRRLSTRSTAGRIALVTPTLSVPFYHLFLTGVPPELSGVRSNRFDGRARHDSVADRVRAAGGEVFIVAEGLDWLRRMHGRAGDGGSNARDSIDGELQTHLARFARARAPSLLLVHVTSTDSTAHHGGIHTAHHRAALARADEVIAKVAEDEDAVVFVLSDHGHRAAGGHGGPEPEVAFAPLLLRAPARSGILARPVHVRQLAATFSAWLGVPAPRSATAPAAPEISPASSADDPERSRLSLVASRGRALGILHLRSRRSWTLALVGLGVIMLLGTIKRAYGFDRSTPLAMVLWPSLVLGIHRVLDRPLSFSAIDTRFVHGVRVLAIGSAAAIVAFVIARILAREGDRHARSRRTLATIGWSAFASAAMACAWIGFALGPWPLTPIESYAPLLLLGAAAPALSIVALALLGSARSRPSS